MAFGTGTFDDAVMLGNRPVERPLRNRPIKTDFYCERCQYNLRGLVTETKCPECGWFILDTPLAFASLGIRQVRRVYTGICLQALGLALPFVAFGVAIVASIAQARIRWPRHASLSNYVFGIGIVIAGFCWFASLAVLSHARGRSASRWCWVSDATSLAIVAWFGLLFVHDRLFALTRDHYMPICLWSLTAAGIFATTKCLRLQFKSVNQPRLETLLRGANETSGVIACSLPLGCLYPERHSMAAVTEVGWFLAIGLFVLVSAAFVILYYGLVYTISKEAEQYIKRHRPR